MLWPQQLFLPSIQLTQYSKLLLPFLGKPGAFAPLHIITAFLGTAFQAFQCQLGRYLKTEGKA